MGCKIITVGLSPSWDVVCWLDGIDWGEHKTVSQVSIRPAGKALNISRALAWMGISSIVTGLWGADDYLKMRAAIRSLRGLIKIKLTTVEGITRQNISIVDRVNRREMHLRMISELASRKALSRLQKELKKLVTRNSICIFAGAMPEQSLEQVIDTIKFCVNCGARVVVDTSGRVLKEIINACWVWLITPNVDELSQLVGQSLTDDVVSLAKAGQGLLGKTDIVLISRGKKGSIVVARDGFWQGRYVGMVKGAVQPRVLSTVGCGDYLLAGFLKGLIEKGNRFLANGVFDRKFALATAIKVATAKAWGWTEQKSWQQVKRQIKVKVVKSYL